MGSRRTSESGSGGTVIVDSEYSPTELSSTSVEILSDSTSVEPVVDDKGDSDLVTVAGYMRRRHASVV